MKELMIMVGVPGSGKTTLCHKMIDNYKKLKKSILYVSRDKLREWVCKTHGEELNNVNYFAHEDEVFKYFVENIQKGMDDKKDIVIADATHINTKGRYKLLKNLDCKDYEIVFVNVNTPLRECLLNNAKREGVARVPETAIRSMMNSYTHPRYDFYIADSKNTYSFMEVGG